MFAQPENNSFQSQRNATHRRADVGRLGKYSPASTLCMYRGLPPDSMQIYCFGAAGCSETPPQEASAKSGKRLPTNGELRGVLLGELETMGVKSKVGVAATADRYGSAQNVRKKTSMKIIKTVIIGAAALTLVSAGNAFAIEGLKLSVQCSDVVLSWPSSDTNNQYFLVQYRPTLDPTNQWQTLASWLPADYGTNRTHFVHSGIVQGCVYSSMAMAPQGGEEFMLLLDDTEPEEKAPRFPLALRADGSSAAVPLNIYPPGFDLTGFLILDPQSGEWLSGDGYTTKSLDYVLESDGPGVPGDPGDPQEGGGITDPPDTGFYRVVQHGIRLLGITNGMTLSGTVTFPVEVGAESGTLVALSVREEGAPVGNSVNIAPFALPLHVVLDTTAMSNGVHQISGFASWSSGGDDGSGVGEDAESDIYTINVNNEITFPNWIEHYGELYDAVLITAQSAHTNADWYIDIYGSEAGYIGTFGGHTDDGDIYAWWDLIGPPPNFISYADQRYFDFVVTTEYDDGLAAQGSGPQPQAAGSSTSAPKRTYKQNDNWTSRGMWVVANQQAWEGSVGHDTLDMATDGFVQAAEINGLTVRPSHPYNEAFRIGYGEGIPESTRNSQWAALRAALYHQESRNFFYLGHGSPDGIGGSANTNRFIKATEIATMLHTIPAGQTNRHGYRFVFLYGCETASGTLPESFGIVHRENVPGIDYVNSGLTPGAFAGWNHKQSAGILSSTLLDNANYLIHFQEQWAGGIGVREALRRAKANYTDVGFINFNKMKVFGNWELSYWAYNR